MRARVVVLVAGLAVAVTACTAGTGADPRSEAGHPAAPATPAAAAQRELLILGSSGGAAVLDAATGSELFASVGVPALGDWSMLATATATPTGDATLVRVTDDVSG